MKTVLYTRQTPSLPTCSSDIASAESFSDFFIEKIRGLRLGFSPSCSTDSDRQESVHFSVFSPVNHDEMLCVLSHIKPKYCAIDPIPSWIVITLRNDLADFLCEIVNASLSSGEFPTSEKRAVVTPLLKKPGLDKQLLCNYRPVSCISFLSKLMERLVVKRLDTFVERNCMCDPFQSAYKTGFSTETALLRLNNDLSVACQANLVSCVVFLDLSSAFDTIDHDVLIDRLHRRYGVNDIALLWFRSYLSNRSMTVRIGNSFSAYKSVLFGVPQGSVLGPRLFSLYLDPIGSIIPWYDTCHITYADDITLYKSFPPNNFDAQLTILENCMCNLRDWLNCNRLCLNFDKTEVLLVAPKSVDTLSIRQLTFCDAQIPFVSVVKCLGIFIDKHLTFDHHLKTVFKSSFLFIRAIYRIRKYLSERSSEILLSAYVASRLDYCNSVFHACTSRRLDRLQRIVNVCARLVKKLPRRSPTSEVLRQLQWLPVRLRILFKIACLVHKCVYGPAPFYLRELLSPAASSNVSTCLRSQSALRLYEPPYRLHSFRGAFVYSAPRIWNSLTPECRRMQSFRQFRLRLKRELLSSS
jgi:hypothetical protein